jgi:membrane-associated phospholipid phosphatase
MLKTLFDKYKHGLLFLYGLIYFPWFSYLNSNVTLNEKYYIIHLSIDDKIPFIEYFIIPYLIWFFYVTATIIFFFFKDKKGFYKYCAVLFSGMTVFLIISTIFSNGHDLRPTAFDNNSIFINLIKRLYQTDAPINIFPSIHVYNSICTHIAISKNSFLKNKKWLQHCSLILMISIICSTVFIKQHSIVDIIGAFILILIIYPLVYHTRRKTPSFRWEI